MRIYARLWVVAVRFTDAHPCPFGASASAQRGGSAREHQVRTVLDLIACQGDRVFLRHVLS